MMFAGIPIETSVVDPVTGEPVFGADAVVPEDADNLLDSAGGCCGGSCCQ